ncbi:hypothetical protein IFM46972_00522 [Aspergillus udagawae]|uniref:Uncharacterized protein n=1 Tax=Aspergillus udagawae TaxID=91492 RepID=A0A8H3RL10_9EURO|nr:hypothetical protein IFM46972_00522 [Aspergillus udagawae]
MCCYKLLGGKQCSILQNLLSLIAALKLKSDTTKKATKKKNTTNTTTNTAATTRVLLAALEDGDAVRDWPLDPSEVIETRPPVKVPRKSKIDSREGTSESSPAGSGPALPRLDRKPERSTVVPVVTCTRTVRVNIGLNDSTTPTMSLFAGFEQQY